VEGLYSHFCKRQGKCRRQAAPGNERCAGILFNQQEEWYTYDKSPRANVHVLASVDEASYDPQAKVKMGDHPVVWTNEHYKARNIYIFMGHSPNLFDNPAYTKLFSNAIFGRQPQIFKGCYKT
jgi:type 1 glutamine amidotransferase